MAMNINKGNNCVIAFKDQEHEMFYRNFLQNCKSKDVYHKALAYCLGINGDTRRNVERIYSGNARVVRMAFNLFCNGTPSVYVLEGEEKVKECRRYTVEDLFCCEYAVYFWEAVKVRYPEYCFPVD